MKTIHLRCSLCQALFERKKSLHDVSLRRGQTDIFCSRSCSYASRKVSRKLTCPVCKEQVLQKETGQKFCSTACSNKARAKPQPTKPPKSVRLGMLDSSMTLGELRAAYTTLQYHSKLRMDARRRYDQSGKPKACANCGYDLHVEVCHIRDLKTFEMSSTIGEVNSPDNLIALDPRCHWEFDNGLLPEFDVSGGCWTRTNNTKAYETL